MIQNHPPRLRYFVAKLQLKGAANETIFVAQRYDNLSPIYLPVLRNIFLTDLFAVLRLVFLTDFTDFTDFFSGDADD